MQRDGAWLRAAATGYGGGPVASDTPGCPGLMARSDHPGNGWWNPILLQHGPSAAHPRGSEGGHAGGAPASSAGGGGLMGGLLGPCCSPPSCLFPSCRIKALKRHARAASANALPLWDRVLESSAPKRRFRPGAKPRANVQGWRCAALKRVSRRQGQKSDEAGARGSLDPHLQTAAFAGRALGQWRGWAERPITVAWPVIPLEGLRPLQKPGANDCRDRCSSGKRPAVALRRAARRPGPGVFPDGPAPARRAGGPFPAG